MTFVVLGLLVAALSLVLVPAAPSYDPWAWLLWGREVAHGTLETTEGPAFKPLPVAAAAVLSPLGGAAPVAWLLLARAGGVLAVALAARLARDLAREAGGAAGGAGRRVSALAAALVAAVGVALATDLPALTAQGSSEGLLLALALAAVLLWRSDRPRGALGMGTACALLRVEAWPFLALAAVVHLRRRPRDLPGVLGGAVAIPALWLVPELLGSGDLWRSAARARVPNPGNPALADVPALDSVRRALGLGLPPLTVVALGLALIGRRRSVRPAAVLALSGAAWIVLVAVMAEAGFSGEERYALPAVALLAVPGAVALALLPRPLALLLAVLVLVAAAPRTAELARLPGRLDHARRLSADLEVAIARVGGRTDVLACGRPYVGPVRGPLLAYRLGVPKPAVEPDAPPRAPGTIFVSRLTRDSPPRPAVPRGFEPLAVAGGWRVFASCRRGGLRPSTTRRPPPRRPRPAGPRPRRSARG